MTLLDCTVLSLRDACVYYPCCKGCCCRIEPDVRDTSRWRCARCGYSCARELVDYRYRLSVRVTRDQRIFGITVFGPCLNPYFGIPACGLKRLVESLEGPSEATMRSTVLARAVEDCFIGRCFFFGIKGTDPGVMPWSSLLNKGRDGPVHLTASQMILPVPTGLSGCSVVSYYRRLLQKTAEFELISADPSKSLRRPVSALLLTPQSPHPKALSISSFACSLPSLQHHNSSLASTLPWQQSPGLVTSSAESSFEDFVDRDHHHRAESRSPSFVLEPSDEPAPEHFGSRNCALEFPPRLPPNTSAGDEFALSESLSESVDLQHPAEVGSLLLKCNRKSGASVDLSNSGRHHGDRSPCGCNNPPASSDVHEEDVYNCSADLFSETPTLDANRATCCETPAGRSPPDWPDGHKARPTLSPARKRLRDLRPDSRTDQTAAPGLCSDFLPASQSTPIVVRAAASSCRTKVQLPLKERVDPRHHLGVEPCRVLLQTSQPVSELEHPQNSPGLRSPQTKRVFSREALSEDLNMGSWSESSCCSSEGEACDWSRDLFSDC